MNQPLSQLCQVIFTGIPPRQKTSASAREGIELAIVGIRAISAQGGLLQDQLESMVVSKDSIDSSRALRVDDVLLSIRGSLPKSGIVERPFDQETYASGNLAVLRPNRSVVHPAYLWACVLRIGRTANHPLLMRATTGQLSIRVGDLSKLQISVPSLDQQKRIGDAALALRNAIDAQRVALEQGERTLSAFLAEAAI